MLSFASDLENTTIAAYIDALPKLTEPQPARDRRGDRDDRGRAPRGVRTALGGTEAPSAFVTGQPSDDSSTDDRVVLRRPA